MLDELSAHLDEGKIRDILGRLEKKQIEQALPAEVELAMLWSLSKIGPVSIEPIWPNRRPEALSEHLIPGHAAVVEVAALSDASLPGDEGMRNAVEKLRHQAGQIRRGAGAHLSFFFAEERLYQPRYIRRVKVPRSLAVTDEMRQQLQHWLRDDRPDRPLKLESDILDVTITWHDERQHRYSYRSTMPAEVHDLEDNHLRSLLERKANQLKNPAFGGLRVLLIGDAGSTLVRDFDQRDHLRRFVSGTEIVQHFLRWCRNFGQGVKLIPI